MWFLLSLLTSSLSIHPKQRLWDYPSPREMTWILFQLALEMSYLRSEVAQSSLSHEIGTYRQIVSVLSAIAPRIISGGGSILALSPEWPLYLTESRKIATHKFPGLSSHVLLLHWMTMWYIFGGLHFPTRNSLLWELATDRIAYCSNHFGEAKCK